MSTYKEITEAQTDAGEPVNEILVQGDENLEEGGIRHNFINHEDRITALEGGGSGGGGGGDIEESFARILQGGRDNVAVDWHRRWKYSELAVMPIKNIEAAQLESDDHNVRFFYEEELVNLGTSTADSRHYLGWRQLLAKDTTLYFKLKKGENYFSIGHARAGICDNLEVRINGATPSSLGLQDRNGDVAVDDIDSTAGVTIFQVPEHYYGLSESQEVIVSLKNNDSASKDFWLEYVEIGYRKPNISLDTTMKISKGTAEVNGSIVDFSDQDFTFSEPGESNGYGYEAAVVIDSGGALTSKEGLATGQTEIKHGETIAFSGAVTSLPVKSNFYFYDDGICLLQMPRGSKHWFSYGGRDNITAQGSTLDDILWQSKPQEDITPGLDYSGGLGEGVGDISITYWAKAPIEITAANQAIDWSITIDGVVTQHSANVPTGFYSSNIVRIGDAIVTTMTAVKPLQGEYFAEYNPTSKKWSIGTDSPEVEQIDFLFNTGANAANTIAPVLGHSSGSDQSGDTSYTGSLQVKSLAVKAMAPDNEFIFAEDSRLKYTEIDSTAADLQADDAETRMGLPNVRKFQSDNGDMIGYYPDPDSTGGHFVFLAGRSGTQQAFYIDGRGPIYGVNTQTTNFNDSNTARAQYRSFFLAWPKGSKQITIFNEVNSVWQHTSIIEFTKFVGVRPYFNKPPVEDLDDDERLLTSKMIWPLQIYAKKYGHNGSTLYSPNGTTHIGTVTETGTWVGAADTSGFNRNVRQSTVDGSYQEWEVTLAGNGGGIGLMSVSGNGENSEVAMYVSAAVINEGTDLIQNTHLENGRYIHGNENHVLLGLRAGTYNVRVKLNSGAAARYRTHGIVVYDSVKLEENANTVTDVSSTGSGVIWPIHGINHQSSQDDTDRVLPGLFRNQYKEGLPGSCYTALSAQSFINQEDLIGVSDKELCYYHAYSLSSTVGGTRIVNFPGRGVTFFPSSGSARNVDMLTFLDGTQTVNSISERVQVLGGSGPTARDNGYAAMTKFFQLTITHNAGDLYNMGDTRGLRDGQRIRLFDGTQLIWEEFTVTNITTNTSFETEETPDNIVPAQVTMIDFSGYHSAEYRNQTATVSALSYMLIEPLPIQVSKIRKRLTRKTVTDVASNNIYDGSGTDGSYPIHKDGIPGNWGTSSISIIKGNGSAFDIPQDLKNLPAVDLKITSTREIVEDIDIEEF